MQMFKIFFYWKYTLIKRFWSRSRLMWKANLFCLSICVNLMLSSINLKEDDFSLKKSGISKSSARCIEGKKRKIPDEFSGSIFFPSVKLFWLRFSYPHIVENHKSIDKTVQSLLKSMAVEVAYFFEWWTSRWQC